MKRNKSNRKPSTIQYTLRGVPAAVDAELRDRAHSENKSLNEIVIAILEQALDKPRKYRDLDCIIGTWVEDPAFDAVIADHDKIDEEMWR